MDRVAELESEGWLIRKTSAKTGRLVNETFDFLARAMLAADAADDADDDDE